MRRRVLRVSDCDDEAGAFEEVEREIAAELRSSEKTQVRAAALACSARSRMRAEVALLKSRQGGLN